MLRKIIILTCLCLPLAAFSQKKKKRQTALLTTQASAHNDKTDYRQLGAPLPDFRVVTLDGRVITPQKVQNTANLILMMFNPTCEHCEDMTMSIEKHIALFHRSKIVMVAGEAMQPYLADFVKVIKTNDYPVLQVGLDSSGLINKLYNYSNLPQLNVYDHDRKLIRTLNGITEIDSLQQYIE